ncbi:Telomeric DNA-binding factor trf1-like protein [Elsinoe fawcettii]|nr:Telomeric DNA-binding factor trf1-like protein [Elsinoe fawcettii]
MKSYSAGSARQNWTKTEIDALIAGLEEVQKPSWSRILAMHGRGGSESELLMHRNATQLKDKARNLRMGYLRSGLPVPKYLQHVTGNLLRWRKLQRGATGDRGNRRSSRRHASGGQLVAFLTSHNSPQSESVKQVGSGGASQSAEEPYQRSRGTPRSKPPRRRLRAEVANLAEEDVIQRSSAPPPDVKFVLVWISLLDSKEHKRSNKLCTTSDGVSTAETDAATLVRIFAYNAGLQCHLLSRKADLFTSLSKGDPVNHYHGLKKKELRLQVTEHWGRSSSAQSNPAGGEGSADVGTADPVTTSASAANLQRGTASQPGLQGSRALSAQNAKAERTFGKQFWHRIEEKWRSCMVISGNHYVINANVIGAWRRDTQAGGPTVENPSIFVINYVSSAAQAREDRRSARREQHAKRQGKKTKSERFAPARSRRGMEVIQGIPCL